MNPGVERMCTSKPKSPPPPVIPQITQPELVDQAVVDTRTRERRRRQAAGFSSTLVTGAAGNGAGAAPTSGAKMLLGS